MALPSSNLFKRDDTLLGICEGLGQDLGINPTWLRLVFLPSLFFFPAQTIAAYLLLGVIVLTARTLFPVPAVTANQEMVEMQSISEPDATIQTQLPLAA